MPPQLPEDSAKAFTTAWQEARLIAAGLCGQAFTSGWTLRASLYKVPVASALPCEPLSLSIFFRLWSSMSLTKTALTQHRGHHGVVVVVAFVRGRTTTEESSSQTSPMPSQECVTPASLRARPRYEQGE